MGGVGASVHSCVNILRFVLAEAGDAIRIPRLFKGATPRLFRGALRKNRDDLVQMGEIDEGTILHNLKKRFVEDAKKCKSPVACYTVNTVEDLEKVIAYDVDAVITDTPEEILQALKRT